jgi:hypothetical protein
LAATKIPRHCERSEAIQNRRYGIADLGCFVASLLAMTTQGTVTTQGMVDGGANSS